MSDSKMMLTAKHTHIIKVVSKIRPNTNRDNMVYMQMISAAAVEAKIYSFFLTGLSKQAHILGGTIRFTSSNDDATWFSNTDLNSVLITMKVSNSFCIYFYLFN